MKLLCLRDKTTVCKDEKENKENRWCVSTVNCPVLTRTGFAISEQLPSSQFTVHLTHAVRRAWAPSISPLHEPDVKLSQPEELKGCLVGGPCLLLLLWVLLCLRAHSPLLTSQLWPGSSGILPAVPTMLTSCRLVPFPQQHSKPLCPPTHQPQFTYTLERYGGLDFPTPSEAASWFPSGFTSSGLGNPETSPPPSDYNQTFSSKDWNPACGGRRAPPSKLVLS